MSRRAELTRGDLEYYLMRMRQGKEAASIAKSPHQRIHEALQSQSF